MYMKPWKKEKWYRKTKYALSFIRTYFVFVSCYYWIYT